MTNPKKRPNPPPLPIGQPGIPQKPGQPSDRDHGDKRHNNRTLRRIIKSPCNRPPAAPTGVNMKFHAIESKTHLNFAARIVWDPVTTDTSGLNINDVDRFEVQYRALDADGDPVEVEHRNLVSATNPTGGRYHFKTARNQTWQVGDKVKVTGCFPETNYNGVWTIDTVVDNDEFEVTGGIAGTPDAKRPGEVYNQSTDYNIRRKHRNPQPKVPLKSAKMVVLTSDHHNINDIRTPSGTTYRISVPTAHGVALNDYVKVENVAHGGYNGVWKVTNIVDADTFDVLGNTSGLPVDTSGDLYDAKTAFEYATRTPNGFNNGQKVRIAGNRPEVDYNGTWNITNIIDDKTFQVQPNRNPDNNLINAETPGTAYNEEDILHILVNHLPRPKTWLWQARVRARSGKGCWGAFSAWTAAELPWADAEPKPPVPTFSATPITFDTKGKGRDSKVRLLFTFDEVKFWDVPGGDREDDVRAYAVQLDRSDDAITWDGGANRTHVRPANDNDADTTRTSVFHNIRRRYWYRCRVRTIDRFNRHGDWSAWSSAALPFDDNRPPAPTNVETWNKNTDRVPIRWDDPLVDVPTRGTATVTNGSGAVTGVGTKFTIEVREGSLVRFAGSASVYTVTSVVSDTSLNLEGSYAESSGSKALFIQEDDPDVAYYEWQIAKTSQVTNGTPDIFNHIYDHGRTKGNFVSVKVQPADQNLRFKARVRSIDAAHNRSPWVSAWIRANHGGLANNSSASTGDDGGIETPVATDGVPPASSPAANAAGYVGYIASWWLPITNTDPVTYDVHISTSAGFTPSSATLVGSTPGTSAVITRYNDGTALLTATNYYVRIVARDGDGSAAAGTQAGPVQTKAQVSDGAAPSTSPTPFLVGSGDFIKASWGAITNADPVSYEVHVSTSSGFTPTSSTLFAVTNATSILVTRLPPMTSGGTALVPGTTYYVKLIARDFDGAATAGAQGSAVAPGQLSDGSAPQLSPPVAAVRGGVGFLAVTWVPLTYGPRSSTANPDPVTYEVHLSTTNPPAGDATTKVGEVQGSSFFIKRTAAGLNLVYGTTYYVGLKARDADGTAAMGTVGSGTLTAATSDDIAVGAVSADKILAGAITAEKLTANLAVSGKFIAALDVLNWQDVNRIEIDGTSGLRLIGDDGTTESVLVNMPIDGSPATFKGGLDADAISVSGPATFRSPDNSMEPGSVITMAGSVPNPTGKASITSFWPTFQLSSTNRGTHKALSYSTIGGSGGATNVWWAAYLDDRTGDWIIGEYNATTYVLLRSITIRPTDAVYGVARGSSYVYVLYKDGGDWWINRYLNSTLALQQVHGPITAVQNDEPGLFWDGTNLVLITTTTTGSASDIRFRKFTDLVASGTNFDSGPLSLNADKTRLSGGVLATNSGQTYYYIGVEDRQTQVPAAVLVFNPTTLVEIATSRFADDSGKAPSGITYNPNDGRFYSMPQGSAGEFRSHTNAFAFSDNTVPIWFAYAWRDNDVTGGNHETSVSPRQQFVWRRRSWTQVTWPSPPPDRGGTDDPNTTRVYAAQSATDPGIVTASYFRQATVNFPQTSNLQDVFSTATAGTAPPAFPNVSNPGKVSSSSGRTQMSGDDSDKLARLMVQAGRNADNNLTLATWFLWTPAVIDFEYLVGGLVAGAMLDVAGANPTRFIVPTGWGGLWKFTVQLCWTAGADSAGRTEVMIRKNAAGASGGGTQMRLVSASGSDAKTTQVCEWQGPLVAADYLEVFAQSVVTDRDLQGNTAQPGQTFAAFEFIGD